MFVIFVFDRFFFYLQKLQNKLLSTAHHAERIVGYSRVKIRARAHFYNPKGGRAALGAFLRHSYQYNITISHTHTRSTRSSIPADWHTQEIASFTQHAHAHSHTLTHTCSTLISPHSVERRVAWSAHSPLHLRCFASLTDRRTSPGTGAMCRNCCHCHRSRRT